MELNRSQRKYVLQLSKHIKLDDISHRKTQISLLYLIAIKLNKKNALYLNFHVFLPLFRLPTFTLLTKPYTTDSINWML